MNLYTRDTFTRTPGAVVAIPNGHNHAPTLPLSIHSIYVKYLGQQDLFMYEFQENR